MMTGIAAFGAGALLTGALITFGHYWFRRPRDLNRLEAYAYGTASITAGLAMIWSVAGALTLFDVVGIDIVAGLVTLLAYQYDKAREYDVRASKKVQDYERKADE